MHNQKLTKVFNLFDISQKRVFLFSPVSHFENELLDVKETLLNRNLYRKQ